MPVATPVEQRVIPRPSARGRVTYVRSPLLALDTNRPWLTEERSVAVLGPLFVLIAAVGFGLVSVGGRAQTAGGVIVAPVLAIVVFSALRKWTQPVAGDGFVSIVFLGFAVRLMSSVPRIVGGVDSLVYHREGARMANHFRALDFGASTGRSIPGTGALRYFVGLVNVTTASNFITTYLIFTTLAFVGQVAFLLGVRSVLNYRQFRIATFIVMLWPSLTFWPSSIGKESAVLFGLGFCTLGAAKLYERSYTGMVPLIGGLFCVGMVRPHVAMIVLSALLIGFFAQSDHGKSRMVVHLGVLVVTVVGAMWLTDASASLFGLEQLDGIEDLSAALDFAQARTSQDQAVFVAPRVEGLFDYPWAAVTVLFRPFPWEATNLFALFSGVEGLVLAFLLVAAAPGLLSDARRLLDRSLLLNCTSFLLVFVFLFSAIGNFGILSRQRVQMLPFVLLIVAVGLGSEGRSRRSGEAAVRSVGRPVGVRGR